YRLLVCYRTSLSDIGLRRHPMLSRTVTAVLDAPQANVFDFLSRVENLPLWATDFARELKYEDGKPKVVNGLGEFYFTIDADPSTGVIDMHAGPDEQH